MRKLFGGAVLAAVSLSCSGGAIGQEPVGAPSDSLVEGTDAPSDPTAAAPVASSDVERAKQLITDGRFEEALNAALAAQKANPDSFEAVYYAGMAHLGLRQYDAAQAAAQRAYAIAPSGAHQQIDKLVSTINQMRGDAAASAAAAPSAVSADAVDSSEAEVALADGLVAKAARIYDSLFQANPNETELGLKAADLYANRLSQWADAGRLLNQVVKTAPESPEAEKANAELARLQPQLTEAYNSAVMGSFAQDWPAAAASLRAASAVNAKSSLPLWLTIPRAVEVNDTKAVQQAIVELAKRGPVSAARLASVPGIGRFTAQPAFMQFLTDVLGTSGAQAIASQAKPPVSAKPMLDALIAKRELMYFIGRNCQGPCGTSALFQVASVNEAHRCSWTVNFGKPLFNAYSDQPTSWKVSWFNSAPVQVRSQFDPRTPWPMIGTEDVDQLKEGRYIGFVVKTPAAAAALQEALRQKSAYCMGSI